MLKSYYIITPDFEETRAPQSPEDSKYLVHMPDNLNAPTSIQTKRNLRTLPPPPFPGPSAPVPMYRSNPRDYVDTQAHCN